MENCIFCKIINKEIPAAQFWEDDNFIALFDIFPNTKGQAVLISKKHVSSDIKEIDTELLKEALPSLKELSTKLAQKLGYKRIGYIIEGEGVNHFHIKLYPMHNYDKFTEDENTHKKVYFNEYKGYLTSQSGETADKSLLDGLVGEFLR